MTQGSGVRLVCSVGTENYSDCHYRLGEQEHFTRFAPVALAHILPLRGGTASVLVTAQARGKWYDTLAAELAQAGIEPEPLDMPDGRTEAEILEIFDRVVRAVGESERVVLDVTFALRHLPFVYLAALTYLTAHRNVTIEGIYYGAWTLRDSATNRAPILDVTSLFNLSEWYHALQSARDSGDLRRVAALMAAEAGQVGGRNRGRFHEARQAAADLADALAAGLPIEAGLHAKRLGIQLGRLVRDTSISSPLRLALDQLRDWQQPWSVPRTCDNKRSLELTRAELERQLMLADWYVERNDIPNSLVLLREWVVDYVLWRQRERRWLSRDARLRAERLLQSARYRAREGLGNPTEQGIVQVWERITDPRNAFAHGGRRPEMVRPADVALLATGVQSGDTSLPFLITCCRQLLDDPTAAIERTPTGGVLLVSAFGHSPGLLFSAVQLVEPRPDRLFVPTSADARGRLAEALARAGASDLPCKDVVMQDPYTGYGETKGLIDEDVRRRLADAREVVVNLTGGTTVMQLVLSRIAEKVRRLGTPVRRVALVDRRPSADQRENPYVLGEVIEIKPEEDEDGNPV